MTHVCVRVTVYGCVTGTTKLRNYESTQCYLAKALHFNL